MFGKVLIGLVRLGWVWNRFGIRFDTFGKDWDRFGIGLG